LGNAAREFVRYADFMRWLLVALAACSSSRADDHAVATNFVPSSGDGFIRPSAGAVAAFDRYRRPDLLIEALALPPGAKVADVGAGRGYLTHRLAAAVGPRGRVVSTDIDGEALSQIGAAARGEAPIETRLVRADDPGLERGAYDRVLLSEVDHLLGDRVDYLRRLARALAPGGRIAVTNRRLYRAPLVDAAARAGLRIAGERSDLPAHFVVLLEVP
jgi:SAM-dependent methyltransferase